MSMKNLNRLLACMSLAIALPCSALAAEGITSDQHAGKALVSDFWSARTLQEQQSSQQQLLDAAPDIATLYQWLRDGPVYSAAVGRGQREDARVADDGTRFPYVYLIPDNYDPAIIYPLEFMLHGGVSRPPWEAGGDWWRRGYDAFWWHQNQAESLPAILKTLKQSYNIDDNRVTLTGVSDGGTGVYFFAFKQPTQWAAFLPYIGHPGVLRNARSGGGYQLYFENLMNRPLYIVNGEDDPLYPVSSVRPYIDMFEETGVDYVFTAIENGGHNTRWLPDEAPMIEQFKLDNPRDPLPESVQWVADRTDRYNRNLWIRIDQLAADNSPGILQVSRQDNRITVQANAVAAFTLLLNPEELDFNRAITVVVNDVVQHQGMVAQDMTTLLDWARRDLDRSLLFSAELHIEITD